MPSPRTGLTKIFSQVLEIHDEQDAVSASMETVANWDSMAHIFLILSVEQRFRISFTPEEAALITSFAEMEDLVERKLTQNEGATE